VLADRVTIGRNARIGAPNATNPVLIGAQRRVRAGETLSAGAHLEPSNPRDLLGSS
jgi:hypothetical protein